MLRSSKLNRVLVVAALFFAGCATTPLKPIPPAPPAAVPVPPPVAPALVPPLIRLDSKDIPAFEDDADTASLHAAVLQSLAYYQSLPQDQIFTLGVDTYTASDMAASMDLLRSILETVSQKSAWVDAITSQFAVYQSIGVDADRTVTFSSYYEPSISVRAARTKKYRFPLYARPADLIDVDLSRFDGGIPGGHIAGRQVGHSLAPYPTRADIDGKKILQDAGLEIAWAKDPMDVLDLQIEGSGWLDYGKGDVKRVRYDGTNGRKYRSVGQYLISTGRIPAKKFTRAAFLHYMARHPEERQELLNINERYVFFRIDTSTAAVYAYGNIDVPLTAGRSVATDPKYFPKGALVWVDTERAIVTRHEHVKGKTPLRRFMVTQDEGGAIQGPGRVDIFAGHGAPAKRLATHLWDKGKLYFLVKKQR